MAKEKTTDDLKVEYIFKSIETAGLTVTDFFHLTTISRTTLYNWKKGNPVTDQLRLNLAYHTSLKIRRAVDLGKLPLKRGYKKAEKLPAIKRIILKEITL